MKKSPFKMIFSRGLLELIVVLVLYFRPETFNGFFPALVLGLDRRSLLVTYIRIVQRFFGLMAIFNGALSHFL
jgi:hypothetical protein